ncbi:MAG: peptidoglycan DD-metalloendopeptidase family protein [Alphaproteobacteria bacterium]|nr:peptidoglycan DD-metalloendopeptidase family protein [Alphaproteobacteria bacterium]
MIQRTLLLSLFMLSGVLYSITPLIAYASSNEVELKTVKDQLSSEESENKKLKQHVEKIEAELSNIKKRLMKIGRNMRENEEKLKSTQQRIEKLEARKKELIKTLESERISIVKLILMLERIRKTPPEVMIARPNTPYHTAQSALLMENIIPSVKRDVQRLKNNIETLEQLGVDLKLEYNQLENETEKWITKRKKLMVFVKKKEKLYASLDNDIKAYELSINVISLRARDLEDLIEQINAEEQKEIERQKQAKIFRRKPYTSFSGNDSGSARLPVSGIIRKAFHDKDEYGGKNNGLVIEGRSGGLVIAPMGGKVQFVGSFKRFSNIVIIEHPEGYHSLIAGLDEINTVIGDIVKSGEPIGLLPDSALIPRPKLYYELRKNGSPVNPSVKFSELG